MNLVMAKGSHEAIGCELGNALRGAIKHNLALRERAAQERGMDSHSITRAAERWMAEASTASIQMMEGLGRGSAQPFQSIMRYNALLDMLSPEECTTFVAIGAATANGGALLLKNRDKSGNSAFSGPGYFLNREINVILAYETANGNVVVGVTAAGSTGIMVGLNRHGVAAASNNGKALETCHLKPADMYAVSGRPQMLREGLECASARDAARLATSKLLGSPMGLPGMLFFVDGGDMYVIEGVCANEQFAVQHVTDGVVSRSNHFAILDKLNDPTSASSICRTLRAAELLRAKAGPLDRNTLVDFSMDHKHGPSDNSICRHGDDPDEIVTVSATIIEIDPVEPGHSRINIALGSPCMAWKDPQGSISFRMDEAITAISGKFLDGTAFKEFFNPGPPHGQASDPIHMTQGGIRK